MCNLQLCGEFLPAPCLCSAPESAFFGKLGCDLVPEGQRLGCSPASDKPLAVGGAGRGLATVRLGGARSGMAAGL